MAELQASRNLEFSAQVQHALWLGRDTLELTIKKPYLFSFRPGQKVLIGLQGCCREYSIASSPLDDLVFCMKLVAGGKMSERLAGIVPGTVIGLSKPYGYFVHRPGRSVFVATGTGIAPFVSFVKSGVSGFSILHGVSKSSELYYRRVFEEVAGAQYVGCVTQGESEANDMGTLYQGRVTAYLEQVFPGGAYDFYLCGNSAMIREAIGIIDRKFTGSRLFTEAYF